jgi:6-phosphogluconate dehydrogenase
MQGIHVGLTGLAVMEQNLARNVARHGFSIVAQVDGAPCYTYVGDGGAGHSVKMVPNGIE